MCQSFLSGGGQFDGLRGAIGHIIGNREVEAGFGQDLASQFDIGPFHANDDRHLDV